MSPERRSDRAGELRRLLVDPREVCGHLGLDDGAQKQARGLLIKCPWHPDRTPSCSVRGAQDGTIAVKCFGCGASGDVLDLVAVTNGIDARRNFPEVLRLAGELAGTSLDEVGAGGLVRKHPSDPGFPPAEEVMALWATCRRAGDDIDVGTWLRSRALDVGAIVDFDLARALRSDARLPSWARFQGRNWYDVGYRCVLPVFDATGVVRSVRVRRLGGHDGPKALPPAGFRLGGLVMADALGRQLLAEGGRPDFWPDKDALRVVVAEGEPDFLTWATEFSDANISAPAVMGVVAGSWTATIAARIPDDCRVIVRTHHDTAGEEYARTIFETFARRRVKLVRGGTRGCPSCAAWLRGAA